MSSDVLLSEEEINDMNDLFVAFKLMQSLGINPKGITCLEDAKCRLLQYIKDKYGAGTQRHSNVSCIGLFSVRLLSTARCYLLWIGSHIR